MSGAGALRQCEEIAPLFVFYLCDEVDADEKQAIEEHLAACEKCRRQFAEEAALEEAIEAQPQAADQLDASDVVLAQMRSELAERLDDLEKPHVREEKQRFAWLRRWLVVHPVMSGAAVLAMGIMLGTQGTAWQATRSGGLRLDQAVDVRPGASFSEEQLSRMSIAGINFMPSTAMNKPNVKLQLNAEQPVVLTGSLDDENVRQVLTYVVQHGDRSNAGVRLDCLEALKSRAMDKEVRTALLAAARKDENPAVRLKALEALRDASSDAAVRQTLLEALQHDGNPGVRVEAVNLLVRSLETPQLSRVAPLGPGMRPDVSDMTSSTTEVDASMASLVRTLEELRQSDPSRYVRLQSSAALRQISAREH